MALDLLSLVILTVFAVLGAVRGALRTGVRLGCWILGYVGAVLGASSVGPIVTGVLGVAPPLSIAIGGALILLGVWILGTGVIWIVEKHRDEEEDPTAGGRLGGIAFGGLQGMLVVLILGWLGLWVQAAHEVGASVPVPAPGDSVTTNVTSQVVATGLSAVVGDDAGAGTRVVARLAGRPVDSMQRLQALVENPRIVALRQDRAFWSYVRHGAIDAALNQGSFLSIAYDSTLRKDLAEMGLVGPGAAADPRIFRNETRDVLEEVGGRIQDLADSPEMQALSQDPDVQEALLQGDTARLLFHPGVRQFVARVLSDDETTDL
jgi:hypothetical protein